MSVSTSANSEFEIVEVDSDHVKAVTDNLVFMVWRFRTREEPYRAGLELIRKLALTHPEGIGVIQLVETEASPPDDDTRAVFKQAMTLKNIQHFCVIHEGTGFKAAAVRAIVSGLHLWARPTFAHTVHTSVSDAAEWAAKQNELLGRRDHPRRIERTIQALRAYHRARYSKPPR